MDAKQQEVELKYCLYARKSSESDERQMMSIESQINEMRQLARRDGINIFHELKESFSAKQSGERPEYAKLIGGLEVGDYNAILTWAPDRLSRNAGDLGTLVDLMDRGKLIQIRTFSQTFANNPNEKFLLMILCSQAKLENDNRAINIKRGIRARCEMGWRPGVAPLGYQNRHFAGVKDIIVDPERGPFIKEIYNKAGHHGWSGRRIKRWADDAGLTNRSGKNVALSQIFLILNNPFYYGRYEYPKESGNWYDGKHEPLITKELFELVQENKEVPDKVKWGSKQFAFKGIFKCAGCGANITAEEKFKPLKAGGFNRHVYYRCTRQVSSTCKEPYVNEKKLIAQLIEFIRKNEDNIKTSSQLARKAKRHWAVMAQTLQAQGIDYEGKPLSEYANFILNNGTYDEMDEFVNGISSQFRIQNRNIIA